jgi:hypothetical protein
MMDDRPRYTFALFFGLIAFGWALWVVGLVLLLECSGLQPNPGLESPGDPCRTLRLAVLGGFVFLLVASILAFARWSDTRRQH